MQTELAFSKKKQLGYLLNYCRYIGVETSYGSYLGQILGIWCPANSRVQTTHSWPPFFSSETRTTFFAGSLEETI